MNPKTKRFVLAGGGAAAVAVIVAGVVVLTSSGSSQSGAAAKQDVSPAAVVQEFATALATGDTAKAAATTDDSAAAGAALAKLKTGMTGSEYHAQVGQAQPIAEGATTTTVDANVTWTLPSKAPFKYAVKVELRRTNEKWRVHWTPAVIHPQLAEGQNLAYLVTSGDGALRDRDGRPIPDAFAPVVMRQVERAVGGLTGVPGYQAAIVDAAGAPVTVLQELKAETRQSMTVTLDPATQTAAQTAVDQAAQGAAIVAIQPSTGDILAVAQNSAASSEGPIALQNYFEPGSTFKIVTATAALTAGAVTADTPVECPGKATIGTRQITNENQFDLGTVPMHRAFAASCNTSFSKLAADLPADALTNAAGYFGLTSDYDVAGITTNTGRIPTNESIPERVEAGIGQGTMLTTPFGMALTSATVAKGSTPIPRLIREIDTTGGQSRPLPGGVANALRSMMAEVVSSGTARELAPFGNVRGKTGTAQFGDGSQAHGWFTGYRGDLAFAVLVVNGGSSKAAVSLTATFLGAL